VEASERFADGLADVHELMEASVGAWQKYKSATGREVRISDSRLVVGEGVLMAAAYAADPDLELASLALWMMERMHEGTGLRAALLRDIAGNPFRKVEIDATALVLSTPSVRALACTIYDECAFDLLPILADALEDAGCTNAEILRHCREPGEHLRGCWVIDLLLGKK
jgi:hypothetical protein